MQKIIPIILIAMLASADAAEKSPKPATSKGYRIILYVPNSTEPHEYTDVVRIIRSDAAQIIFETQDGFIVIHNGRYTSVQPKDSFKAIW